jgi:diacylglycerol kinase (ATP)
MKPICIVNPQAGAGRALRQLEIIKPFLSNLFGFLYLVVTNHPQEVLEKIRSAAREGYDMVLSIGGDGTNQVVVNALAQLPEHPLTFATLPFGTGRDLARSLEVPVEPHAAAAWLGRAEPYALDIGRVTSEDGRSYFVNVASAGLTGEVARRCNVGVKRPWTYFQAAVSTLLQFGPPAMRVTIDGDVWYEGKSLALAVGNGRYFGRGMLVCPDALLNDGLFDVVLVEGMGKASALVALPSLYSGAHLKRGDVHTRRARHVIVEALGPPLDLEMDGEPGQSSRIEFEVMPGALQALVDPTVEAVRS